MYKRPWGLSVFALCFSHLSSCSGHLASPYTSLILSFDYVNLAPQFRNKDPQATVKAHIKLLHDYNEIRDIGQGLMGVIADNRGVRVSDVYRDFDVDEGD